MKKKGQLLDQLGFASWAITAIASINHGLLAPMGNNILDMLPEQMAGLIQPLHYVIGIAGIISLVMFVQCCRDKR